MIQFFVERNSSVPFHTQLKEQVKIALALGQLRDGEVLPSIREVEAQLGIGRMVALRAYKELERCGILKLRHGHGVTVNHVPDPGATRRILGEFDRLAQRIEDRLEKHGLNPTSFARYFYRKCLLRDTQDGPVLFVDSSEQFAQENADQVSAIWEVRIVGLSIEGLKALDPGRLKRVRTIVTNYYRYEEVRELVKRSSITVVPLRFSWSPEMLKSVRRVPSGARLLVIQSRGDFERHSVVFRKMLEDEFQSKKIHVQMAHFEGPEQLRRQLESRQIQMVIVSNRVWDLVPPDLQQHEKVLRPGFQLSVASILEGQFQAGIVV